MAVASVIHLIDDDDAVRRSLAFSLTAAGLAVRTYESGSAFLEALPGLQPGCIVSDIRMPGVDGLDLQRRLKALQIALPVIIMTGHGDIRLAVEAMKGGAVDFIEKPFDDDTLIEAIRVALQRFEAIEHHDADIVGIMAKLDLLTPREREILGGLLSGHPNKTIAYDLSISARTVEVHRANVMMKMGAASLSDLVRMALLVEMSAPT